MSAKEYIQVYNELHDIGLKYSDFVHFLKLCRKGLIYNTCKIKGSRKELAEMIGMTMILSESIKSKHWILLTKVT